MELAIRKVTSLIIGVMIIQGFLPDHLFLSSASIQQLWTLPQAAWRNLAVSLVGWVVILPVSIHLH